MSASETSIYVPQGKFEVSSSSSVFFSAVLGSCVAACLWDDDRHLGGMNHLLLPPDANVESGQGVHLMELLINALLKLGAEKSRLKVKLFGGSRMIDSLSDVGGRNAEFARSFFAFEGIEVMAESLGGEHARRIQFWPATGRARQRCVPNDTVKPVKPPAPAAKPEAGGDIDLF